MCARVCVPCTRLETCGVFTVAKSHVGVLGTLCVSQFAGHRFAYQNMFDLEMSSPSVVFFFLLPHGVDFQLF